METSHQGGKKKKGSHEGGRRDNPRFSGLGLVTAPVSSDKDSPVLWTLNAGSSFCFVLFCFVLFCFVLFCFVLFLFFIYYLFLFIYFFFYIYFYFFFFNNCYHYYLQFPFSFLFFFKNGNQMMLQVNVDSVTNPSLLFAVDTTVETVVV